MTRKPTAVALDDDPGKDLNKKDGAKKTSSTELTRKPRAMKPPKETEVVDVFEQPSPEFADELPTHLPASTKGFRWGLVFLSAAAALLSLGAGLWVTSIIEAMFARHEWLGWLASALAALAMTGLILFILGEIAALWRLRKLGNIRESVQRAFEDKSISTDEALRGVVGLFTSRKDMKWSIDRLRSHDQEIMDNHDRLILAEQTLMKPLDEEAKGLIAKSAKRIAVVTAVNPAPSLDVLFTGFQILRMLRQVMNLYGSRPGSVGTLKLAGMVGSHLAVTGGLALSDTLIQQFVGKGLAGRLSAKLGEGTVNGIMTARIGLAALDLCRPMPFKAVEKPGLREFLAVIAGSVSTKSS